jgi:hypothetical protein
MPNILSPRKKTFSSDARFGSSGLNSRRSAHLEDLKTRPSITAALRLKAGEALHYLECGWLCCSFPFAVFIHGLVGYRSAAKRAVIAGIKAGC